MGAAILVAAVLLAGCVEAPPTPTPISRIGVVPATGTPTNVPVTLTPTALPTVPTTTPTTVPTIITALPTVVSPTVLPTVVTPTATLLPPTPTSTITPSASLQEALTFQQNGDYARAAASYLALLDRNPPAGEALEARYHLAESYLLDRDYAKAATAWETFISTYPDDARLPHALLMLARAYHQNNDCPRAVPQYQAALARDKTLADLVHEWMGDCYATSSDPAVQTQAIDEYRVAIQSTQDVSIQVGLREKIAGLYLAQSDYLGALAEYDAILKVAKIEEYRAKIEYLAGQALASGGQTEAAQERYLRAFNGSPKTEYGYLSLSELVNAGVPVDELQRGISDYYAGRAHPDAYGAAIHAFERYLAVTPAPKADDALFMKAQAELAAEQPDAALATLEQLIKGYPQSQSVDNAWLEKGITYAWKGDNKQAIKAYQDLAALFPASTLAPDALQRAAKLLSDDGLYAQAAAAYEDLQSRFPGYENADEALWRAGLAYYQAKSLPQATAAWRTLVDKYPKSAYRTKALFWLGKLEAKPTSGPGYWDQVIQADPNGYYALRIGQIQNRAPLTAASLVLGAVTPPVWNEVQAEADLEGWLRGWAKLPASADLGTLPVTTTHRLDFQRGSALLAVGLRTEALALLDGVRAASWNDPVSLARLALYWHGEGLYGLAARAASRLAGLAPGRTIAAAPVVIQRLSYPLAFADLLSSESQARSLDPLLLAALIRQESLFEPAAESYAGARGLGQVMPSTGAGIARSLNMADFILDDLYQPWVSVRFAAYYLGLQLERFDDQVLVALAAYNGGPGNTLHWLEPSGDDLDLFVEVIGASQSRIYLQRVYEQYGTYQRLYRVSGNP